MRETVHPESRPQSATATTARSDSRLLHAIAEHARQRPDAEAVGEVDGTGRSCTYAELLELICERARHLRECVNPGEVVIAVLPSGVDYVAWFCSAIAAGVKFLPMHTQIAGPEAATIARRCCAVAAVVAPGLSATTALAYLAIAPDRKTQGEPSRTVENTELAGAVVLGSSGTTGLPKLALRESPSLDADAAGIIAGMCLAAEDRVLFATPLSHSYGVDVLVGSLMAGATMRVMAQFDAELLARELEGDVGSESPATVLPGVPFVFEALARQKRSRHTRLRLALSAGSPLSPRIRREFREAWGIEVGQLYGATELGTVAMELPQTVGFEPASIGRPLEGVSVRIVDVDHPTTTLPIGEQGQLAVRAESMLTRYLDGDMQVVDGHLLTGDLAKLDESGRVWIAGRLKLLIDVGAYKVNPLEVEQVLNAHPRVAECVVVPVTASETLNRLRAVVVPRDAVHPPATEELRAYLKARLSPIKVPRLIEIASSLPKSATGKVLRDNV